MGRGEGAQHFLEKNQTTDSQLFLEKIKTMVSVPENSILVTADVVSLCPTFPIKQA